MEELLSMAARQSEVAALRAELHALKQRVGSGTSSSSSSSRGSRSRAEGSPSRRAKEQQQQQQQQQERREELRRLREEVEGVRRQVKEQAAVEQEGREQALVLMEALQVKPRGRAEWGGVGGGGAVGVHAFSHTVCFYHGAGTQADVARAEEGQRALGAAVEHKAVALQVARALEGKASKEAAAEDRRQLLGALTTKAAASDVAALAEAMEAMRKEMVVRWDGEIGMEVRFAIPSMTQAMGWVGVGWVSWIESISPSPSKPPTRSWRSGWRRARRSGRGT